MKSIPSVRPGFPAASPYLIFRDAGAAIDFYLKAFGATEISRRVDSAGRVAHGEIEIGGSTFMLTSETPKFPTMRGVESVGDSPVHIFLYVDDVDARFQRAVDAGASVVMAVANQPYGRGGGLKDPFGLVWWLSTHTEHPV